MQTSVKLLLSEIINHKTICLQESLEVCTEPIVALSGNNFQQWRFKQRKTLSIILFLKIDCFVYCIHTVAMVFTSPTFVLYSDDPKAVVANLTVSLVLSHVTNMTT